MRADQICNRECEFSEFLHDQLDARVVDRSKLGNLGGCSIFASEFDSVMDEEEITFRKRIGVGSDCYVCNRLATKLRERKIEESARHQFKQELQGVNSTMVGGT